MTTDCIEKSIVLRAPRSRVWRAIVRSDEFGAWFGMVLDGPFETGKSVSGRLTIGGFEHLTLALDVEQVRPEDLFSFRWHPNAMDPDQDYSKEPKTLVEFRLADVPDGTHLTVSESGFDHIPESRRATAFSRNDAGWAQQLLQIEQYVAR